MSIHCLKQFVDAHPSGAVELKADPLRLVSKNQAQKLARLDYFFLIHRFDR